jgi:hypothetical protein
MAIDRTLCQAGKQHKSLSFWSEPPDTLDRVPGRAMRPDGQSSLKDNGFAAEARRRGTQS